MDAGEKRDVHSRAQAVEEENADNLDRLVGILQIDLNEVIVTCVRIRTPKSTQQAIASNEIQFYCVFSSRSFFMPRLSNRCIILTSIVSNSGVISW